MIIRLTFIPQVFDFVEWILTNQIYLPIFTTSFVFSYLQQMLPIYKVIKEIKEKQTQNRWTVPRLMTNRLVMNVSIWLSAVLFFSGLMMSFGILYPQSIADQNKFSQLQMMLFLVGLALIPVSRYYSLDFKSYLTKNGITFHEKVDWEIIMSAIFVTFFVTLSFLSLINFDII